MSNRRATGATAFERPRDPRRGAVGFGPVRVAGAYLVFALLWIWLTDWLVAALQISHEVVFWASVVKGTAFVVLSTLLVFWLSLRELRALARSSRLLHAVAHGTSDAVFVKDAEGRYLLANEATARFVGKSVEEVIGLTDDSLFNPEEAREVKEDDRAVMTTGEPVSREQRLTSVGSLRSLLTTKTPYRDDRGRIIGVIGIARDTTEKVQVQQELQQERDRLAKIAAAAPGVLYSLRLRADGTSHFPYVTPNVRDIYGIPAEELNRDASLVTPLIVREDLNRMRAVVLESARTLAPVAAEYRVQNPTRGEIWVRSQTAPVREPDGSIVWHGFLLDVTERRREEDALRASEARFRQVFQNAGTGIAITDENSRFLQCNPAYCALLGYTEEELRKIDFSSVLHADDVATNTEMMRRLLARETSSFEIENRYLHRSGDVVWVHKFVTRLEDDRGRPSHMMVLVTDVTERRRSELALRESEERFRTLVEVLPDAVYMSVDRKVAFCNPACVRLFAAPDVQHLIGRSIFDLTHPDHRNSSRRRVAEMEASHEPAAGMEEKILRLDGGVAPVYVTAVPIAGGAKPTALVVLHDLTDRRRLEEQVQQAQKMEAVGRLAGGIAHDFNNLLTVINGYSDMLMSETDDDHPNRAVYSAISEAGERAASLTSQLLAFSRKAIVEPRVIDLNEVVAQSEKLLRRLIGEDVTLTANLADAECRIVADPTQVDQVVMNLAVNARDAMPTGGKLTFETRQIVLSFDDVDESGEPQPGRYIELIVRDTGHGISHDVKARLFEPFFTTKGVGKGTGLGLAVVHGIVKQAGGCITVESEVGQGAAFHLLFPEAYGPSARDSAILSAPAQPGAETLLLVEDEAEVRKLVKRTLEAQGYTLLVAASGQDALEILDREGGPIHLLITDVVMPEMSGRELADVVRSRRPGVRVLFVSGYTDDQILRHGVRAGVDAFLQKPFASAALARKVRSVLDSAQ